MKEKFWLGKRNPEVNFAKSKSEKQMWMFEISNKKIKDIQKLQKTIGKNWECEKKTPQEKNPQDMDEN